MKRHGVTASFHTNEPAGTQTSIPALLKGTGEIKKNAYTYGTVAHTFDIRLQLKLFKFRVNYFFEEFICETSRSDGVFSHK